MACKYIYKGHEFASELELDDFLLEKLPFEPILGDIVFNSENIQNLVHTNLRLLNEKSLNLRETAKKARRKADYTSDGESIINDPPYIGVNKFIGNYRTENNERIIRNFEDEAYWNQRFADWKYGLYNDSEKEIFGITSDKGPEVKTIKELKNLKKIVETKWKFQAKAGDAIHNVLQLFFTKDENNKYIFERTDNEINQYCLENLDEDNIEYIDEEVIKKTIQHGRLLHSKIKNQFGENCIFFPEFVISQKTTTTKPETLLGIIDLLVLDEQGNVHIFDYKTSIKDYEDFDTDKQLAYKYQLYVYKRMLEKEGINVHDTRCMIAPIQIKNFHFDEDKDKWVYDDIESKIIYDNIDPNITDVIQNNINDFMMTEMNISVTLQDSISTVTKMMHEWFPDFSDNRLNNEEAVTKYLKQQKLLKKDSNGNYIFKTFGNEPDIITTDDVTFVKQVTKYLANEQSNRTRRTIELKAKIRDAMKFGIKNVSFPTSNVFIKNGDIDWLKDTLSPYCNGNWEIAEEASNLLEHFGIIMLKTKHNMNVPDQIDFIRISTRNLSANYRDYLDKTNQYQSRRGLTGTFESDITATSKQNNLMLEAAFGNVELIETLLVINQLQGFKGKIGNIQVVNPKFGYGLQATNEELLYCFNELHKHKNVPNNQFLNKTIEFANRVDLVYSKVAHILSSGFLSDWKDEYSEFKNFQPAKDILDQMIQGPNDTESKIQALTKCLDLLTGKNKGDRRTTLQKKLDIVYGDQHHLKMKHIDLHNAILLAIGDLRGVQYRQQLEDHYMWFSNIMRANTEGFMGNYSDNPGNLKSETLNLITKLTTEAYQNTRDELHSKNNKLQELVKKLKKDYNFGFLKENTYGNQADLYKKMYRYTDNGDILFVNPNDPSLLPSEKEFLEFILYHINKDRYPSYSDPILEDMKNKDNYDYYKMPICIGDSQSLTSERGLLSMLRSKLEYFKPKKAWELAKKKAEGILNNDTENKDRQTKTQLLYQMTNTFDIDEDRRFEKLKELNDKNIPLELNLEALFLKHTFAYSIQRNMNSVFPLIKSAMIHIQMQGAQQNKVFTNDKTFVEEYIQNKILNKTIVNPENQGWVKQANMIKKAASLFTLAMAPVQAIYQPLQGLWNDISLMIRKPDQKESFTFNHFKASIKLVFGDLFHFSDSPTLCQLLNELYGINDMDMNLYVERIGSYKKGIWNLPNFLFKFASRPDFYNRMVIFTSQMMGDGCLEAHSVVNGKLVYDWTKDKRFSKFAAAVKSGNGNSTDPEISKQRSLYYAIAKQFVNENTMTIDKNGKVIPFELNMSKPMALPRAYTNKEAESMKSLGDNIYGYYSHEKKSLIMSTCVGSLWLQFRTYWSGKKNQYLGHGGVKLQGSWQEYTELMLNPETGKNEQVKFYYQIGENGEVLYDQPPLSEIEMKKQNLPLIAPVVQWKGLWQEGIILTLSDLATKMWNNKSFKKGWQEKFDKDIDPNLRKVYKCNMQQLAYDFIMFAVIGSIMGALLGDWLDKLLNNNRKNKDFITGLGLSAANIAVMSVKNSFLDFNFFHSIGDPFGQWTPFAVEWGGRTFKNWYNVAMGDEDFWDGVVKTSGGLKQIKPALDAIKPDMWRTKREGGTFNVDE